MIKRKISLTAIVLLCFFASCSNKKEKQEDRTSDAISPAFLTNVKTVKASLCNQEEELTLTGKVEYDPDRVINYTSLVGGVVEKTYFSPGDKVQKGQVLLDIRSSDLSQLQADRIALEADAEVAKREQQQAQSFVDLFNRTVVIYAECNFRWAIVICSENFKWSPFISVKKR